MANHIKLSLPSEAKTDELGRIGVPADSLIDYSHNPRLKKDLDPKTSPSFARLQRDIRQNGILQPVRAFIVGKEIHIEDGHRRVAAVRVINKENKTNVLVPIAIVPAPTEESDRMSSMWKTDTQKEPWSFVKTVEFFKKTTEAMGEKSLQTEEVINVTGLSAGEISRLRRVVSSTTMYEAAVDESEKNLKLYGRQRTIMASATIADRIWRKHRSIVYEVTGLHPPKDEAKEALEQAILGKASQLADSGVGIQSYSGPLCRGVYKNADIRDWLLGTLELDAKNNVYTKTSMTHLDKNFSDMTDRTLQNSIRRASEWMTKAKKEQAKRVRDAQKVQERAERRSKQLSSV